MFTVAILSGGLATRLRPITEKIPKALINVGGEPFINHQLKLLKNQGFSQIVICAWYRGEMIREVVGNGNQFGLNIEYSFDGEQPLGTGGAIKKALPLLGDNFFVLYGDSYLPCNCEKIQKSFISQTKNGLMTIYKNLHELDRSNIEFAEGVIKKYQKGITGPSMKYIDYGLSVFNSDSFSQVLPDKNTDLVMVFQDLLSKSQLSAYEVDERYYEIGSFTGLKELDELLTKNPNFAMGVKK
jgi:N-acetyl-alpha-D-muramate 1-phosphate uridylyltransferase